MNHFFGRFLYEYTLELQQKEQPSIENSNIVKDQAFILNAKYVTDEHLNPAPKAVAINATIMKMNTLVIKEYSNNMRYMQ